MSNYKNKKRESSMMGPPMVGASGEKPKNFKKTMKKLGKQIAGFRLALIWIIIFSIGGTAMMVIGPKILGQAITELGEGFFSKMTGGEGINFNKIAEILIFLFVLYVLSAVFSYLQGWMTTNVSQKLTYQLRKDVAEKVNRMPLSYFDKQSHGETLSIITNDIDTISISLNQSATQIITSFVTVVGILGIMLSIDWRMSLISMIVIPISFVVISFVLKKSQQYFREQQEYLGHVNGQVEEIFAGHNIVQAFNAQKSITKKFDQDNGILYQSAWKAQFISGIMFPVMMFISNLGYVSVAVAGGIFVSKGTIETGYILTFIQYTRIFTQSLNQLAQASTMLQATAAAAERVFLFLDLPEEQEIGTQQINIEQIKGQVHFDQVQFGYLPDQLIIRNFTTQVKPGQKIAIVGPTGAGKTTIIKLLMRFYELHGGAILVDGQNINSIQRNHVRKMFGMVLQDTWLFHGSIMENIRYGDFNASDQQVIEAAKAAHAHHFIKTLPAGYQMILNEETSNISQGQKQLLTIARAILADPKILILDEATSSVDTRTEIRIQKAMDHLMEGRTSFIIAHRLSTIRDADKILVLKDGDIVEQGNHDELIEQKGFYSKLYNAQFEVG